MPPTKVHLTLAVLSLTADEQMERCIRVMEEFAQSIRPSYQERPESHRLHIGNLAIMKGTPRRAQVVYAKVEPANDTAKDACLPAVRTLIGKLKENQLIPASTADLPLVSLHACMPIGFYSAQLAYVISKLHMTLLNTKYCKNTEFIDVHRFDMSADFGIAEFDSLHLCALGPATQAMPRSIEMEKYVAKSADGIDTEYHIHHKVQFADQSFNTKPKDRS
jgi:hypothetical protein